MALGLALPVVLVAEVLAEITLVQAVLREKETLEAAATMFRFMLVVAVVAQLKPEQVLRQLLLVKVVTARPQRFLEHQ